MGAAAPAADAACGGVQHFQPTKLRRPGAPPLAVGDSVMLGAAPQLRRRGFEIDVRGCRQMTEGLALLSARRRAGTLPDVVVVALGTNWTVTTTQIRSALRILGPERVLGLEAEVLEAADPLAKELRHLPRTAVGHDLRERPDVVPLDVVRQEREQGARIGGEGALKVVEIARRHRA